MSNQVATMTDRPPAPSPLRPSESSKRCVWWNVSDRERLEKFYFTHSSYWLYVMESERHIHQSAHIPTRIPLTHLNTEYWKSFRNSAESAMDCSLRVQKETTYIDGWRLFLDPKALHTKEELSSFQSTFRMIILSSRRRCVCECLYVCM